MTEDRKMAFNLARITKKIFVEILHLCYKVLKWLPIATTETLQALLNQKSKGCLKKHSLSLESQRSPRATHNPMVSGSNPNLTVKRALFECPFLMCAQHGR